MGQPEISPMLFLSTAHLRKETAEAMDLVRVSRQEEEGQRHHVLPEGHPLQLVSFDCIEYGYLVWVTDDEGLLKSMPEEIAAAIRFAKQHGCRYIKFDCDVERIDELPSWDW